MPLTDDDKRLITRYLLGESMPEHQVEKIEENFIHNDRYFDELQHLEDRLIADFLAGELTDREADLFEKNFMASPRRRRAVEVQRGMRDFLLSARTGAESSQAPIPMERGGIAIPRARPGLRLAWASAAVAALLCVGLTVALVRERSEVSGLRARLDNISVNASAPAQRAHAAFLLLPGVQRGEQAGNQVSPPPDSQVLHLRLRLSPPLYPAYTATLELPEGAALCTQFRLRAVAEGGDPPYVEVNIPATLIPPGDYVIALAGVDASGREESLPSYVFRVR